MTSPTPTQDVAAQRQALASEKAARAAQGKGSQKPSATPKTAKKEKAPAEPKAPRVPKASFVKIAKVMPYDVIKVLPSVTLPVREGTVRSEIWKNILLGGTYKAIKERAAERKLTAPLTDLAMLVAAKAIEIIPGVAPAPVTPDPATPAN